jgi:hypothetical protein
VTTSLPYPWGRWSRYRPHDGRRQAGLCWKRGKGSWFIEFRVKSGVRVRETVRGSRDDAEERLTQLLREHDVTGIVPDREATVAMFSTRWLAHVAYRVSRTLKRYRRALGRNRTCGPRFRKLREHADGMRLRYVSAGSGSGTALLDL